MLSARVLAFAARLNLNTYTTLALRIGLKSQAPEEEVAARSGVASLMNAISQLKRVVFKTPRPGKLAVCKRQK